MHRHSLNAKAAVAPELLTLELSPSNHIELLLEKMQAIIDAAKPKISPEEIEVITLSTEQFQLEEVQLIARCSMRQEVLNIAEKNKLLRDKLFSFWQLSCCSEITFNQQEIEKIIKDVPESLDRLECIIMSIRNVMLEDTALIFKLCDIFNQPEQEISRFSLMRKIFFDSNGYCHGCFIEELDARNILHNYKHFFNLYLPFHRQIKFILDCYDEIDETFLRDSNPRKLNYLACNLFQVEIHKFSEEQLKNICSLFVRHEFFDKLNPLIKLFVLAYAKQKKVMENCERYLYDDKYVITEEYLLNIPLGKDELTPEFKNLLKEFIAVCTDVTFSSRDRKMNAGVFCSEEGYALMKKMLLSADDHEDNSVKTVLHPAVIKLFLDYKFYVYDRYASDYLLIFLSVDERDAIYKARCAKPENEILRNSRRGGGKKSVGFYYIHDVPPAPCLESANSVETMELVEISQIIEDVKSKQEPKPGVRYIPEHTPADTFCSVTCVLL